MTTIHSSLSQCANAAVLFCSSQGAGFKQSSANTMDVHDYVQRSIGAPRTCDKLPGASGQLLTIHQFHHDGVFYGRIWSPRTADGPVVCRASYFKANHATETTVHKFIVPDIRNDGSIVIQVVFTEKPRPPLQPRLPAIVLSATEHDSTGRSVSSSQKPQYITLYDLQCGGHVGLQVGHIAVEVERDYPWRFTPPYLGNEDYCYAETL
jgi:hypothetical protein